MEGCERPPVAHLLGCNGPVGHTGAVTPDNAAARDRSSPGQRTAPDLPADVVHYGPDIGTEADFKLVGNVDGKRVLELGCGDGRRSIAFARRGANAIGVEASTARLAEAKRLVEREGVKVELRHGDLADLAFVRADTMDVVFSAYAFGDVGDLDRVFRQVHRVLKTGHPLVFSLPHPAYDLIDDRADPDLLIRRSYFDRSLLHHSVDGVETTTFHHTVSGLFTSLQRANFLVDTILEPEPRTDGAHSEDWRPAFAYVPRTLIMRARKQGI